MVFQYINICQVPREMLKTSAYGLGFQHLPRDLANVNAWKTMFDPYIIAYHSLFLLFMAFYVAILGTSFYERHSVFFVVANK